MKLYFAGRFSRRLELLDYKQDLEAAAPEYGADITVNSRWLLGGHEWDVDAGPLPDDVALRFAAEDLEDIRAADLVVCFTEPSKRGPARGGRHVEFGYALALQKAVLIVGHRENIFYTIPERFAETWDGAKKQLLMESSASPALVKRVLELEAKLKELTADARAESQPDPEPVDAEIPAAPNPVMPETAEPTTSQNGHASNGHVEPVAAVEIETEAGEPEGNPWTPDRVRRIRALLGLEREELARRLGVSLFTISNWEKGTTAPQIRFWETLTALDAETKAVAV